METSRLRIYSLGIVAENKELTITDDQGNTSPNPWILATPIEQLMMLDGEIKSNPLTPEAQGTDATGASYSTKVTVDNAVKAKWFNMSSNRHTAPDVRRGERVLLWQYGDTDTFFWSELNWDNHLRKLETVVMTFSGTQDESADSTHPDNCYYLEVSTHEGLITLKTSKANKEFCAYVLQINAKNGVVVLMDDVGNSIQMDAKNTLIALVNSMGTVLNLDKKKIFAHADETITLEAKDSIYLNATNGINLKCKDFLLDASNSVTVKTQTITVTNQTTTFNTTTTTFNGDVQMNGNFTMESGKTADFNGDVNFNGSCTFTKPVSLAGGTSSATLSGPHGSI